MIVGPTTTGVSDVQCRTIDRIHCGDPVSPPDIDKIIFPSAASMPR